jgi:hypothetical protein
MKAAARETAGLGDRIRARVFTAVSVVCGSGTVKRENFDQPRGITFIAADS